MDLHRRIGDAATDIGAVGLGDGGQQRTARGPIGIARRRGHIQRGGAGQTDGAGGENLGARGGQHPAHIGMADDRAELLALSRVFDGLLQRRLAHANALHPDRKPGIVHHREHRRHAAVFVADQPALRALIAHHAGGRAVDPHLVFQRHHFQAVRLARIAVGIGQVFRHHEQADALGAAHPVRQPRQHRVAGVRGHVAVAPGDEDLLPGDGIAAIAIRFGLGLQRAHVRTGPRLGQVHGAVPLAPDQLGQVQCFHLVAGVVLQRLDLALGQQRVQLQRQTRPGHHLADRHVQRLRQARAAIFGIGRQPDPAAFGNRLKPLVIAGRGPQHPVFQPRRGLIARDIQRRQHLRGHAPGLGQDGVDHVGGGLGVSLGRGDGVEGHHVGKDEADLIDGCAVGHDNFLAGLPEGRAASMQGYVSARLQGRCDPASHPTTRPCVTARIPPKCLNKPAC